MIRRLVEQQEVGAAHQRLGEIQPHAPAPGKAGHRIHLAGFGEAQAGKQRGRAGTGAIAADRLVAVMQVGQHEAAVARIRFRAGQCFLDLAELGVAVEYVVECSRGNRRRLLCHMRDGPRRRHVDAAGVGQQLVAQRREETRFAAAVRTHQADFVAHVHRQLRAFEQAFGPTREREVGDT